MFQNNKPAFLALVLAATASPHVLAAEEGAGVLVYGVAGSGGLGLGLGLQMTDRLVVRGELAGMGRNYAPVNNDIDFRGQVKVSTAAVLLDYHLWDGYFRITTGLDLGRHRAGLSAVTRGSTLTVNGVNYTIPAGEGLSASLDYPKAMPYIGIGWGMGDLKKAPGWKFGLDLGVNIGRARGSLSATPGLMADPAFASDLAAQEQKFNKSANKLVVYPLVKLSAGYAF